MKHIALFILLTAHLSSTSQSKAVNWYKHLKGKIGSAAVTMHLHKSGSEYSGFYYYDNFQQPVHFSGDDTSASKKIRLDAEGEVFLFTFDGNQASGTWRKTADSKAAAFSASEAKQTLQFGYVNSRSTMKLRPGWKESPTATIQQASVWPSGNLSTDSFLKSVIKTIHQPTASSEDLPTVFGNVKQKFFREYAEENKDVADADIKAAVYAYSSDMTPELMVCYHSPKILSLAHVQYTYTGGAHGNYGTTYSLIDLSTNKKLEFDDLFTKDARGAMRKLLERQFRKEYGVKAGEKLTDAGLFENSIQPNNNFYITGKGIGFTYNPYEIAPYAMGQIDLFIPFTELKAFLHPNAKRLIQ